MLLKLISNRVAYALLCLPPFSRLPLHLRFFTADVHDLFQQLSPNNLHHPNKLVPRKGSTVMVKLPSLSPMVTVILDLGGVSGKTGLRRQSTQGVTGRDEPIDVQDEDFRFGSRVWAKWKNLEETTRQSALFCIICHQAIETTVRSPSNLQPRLLGTRIISTSLSAQFHLPHPLLHHASA